MVVELVVAERVEASKRPQAKANEGGGFDKLSHRISKLISVGGCPRQTHRYLSIYFFLYFQKDTDNN